jgi:hypothetical protein
MDRNKLTQAILEAKNIDPKDALAESLRYLSDTNLASLALVLGINLEALV